LTSRKEETVDGLTRTCLVVVALTLVWIAARPHVMPGATEAARETVSVDLERVGGRYLSGGAIPVHCADLRH
jgi:hypothetical protein